MQDYLSTNKPLAFNIHPKQHNVKEKQWIMRDEGKLYTYLVPQAKRNRASALSRSFSISLTFGNGNSPRENPQQLYAPPFLLKKSPPSPLSGSHSFLSFYLFSLPSPSLASHHLPCCLLVSKHGLPNHYLVHWLPNQEATSGPLSALHLARSVTCSKWKKTSPIWGSTHI